jgi:hypothetical protein
MCIGLISSLVALAGHILGLVFKRFMPSIGKIGLKLRAPFTLCAGEEILKSKVI